MSTRVFVDSSGWIAVFHARDQAHAAGRRELSRLLGLGTRLITTDYVIDESLTHARRRGGFPAARSLLDFLRGTAAVDLEWVGADRFHAAQALFRKHSDQDFSFTDCTSFVVMRELELTDALTTDAHFRAQGFRPLLA